MADDSQGLNERVDRVEDRLDSQDSKLDQILSRLTGSNQAPKADEPQAGAGGRPEDIAEQVRLELARRDEEAKAASAAEAEKSEQQTIKDQLAKLAEVKPATPQPRRERVMWGKK